MCEDSVCSIMEFDLLAFTLAPTTEVFKQVIKEELYNELVSMGILPAESLLDVSEGNLAVEEASVLPLFY